MLFKLLFYGAHTVLIFVALQFITMYSDLASDVKTIKRAVIRIKK
jgi:hypothetical protein